MQIEVKDFFSVKEMVNFLKCEFFEEKEIFLYCFMATDKTYWKDILEENGFENKELVELMENYLGNKKYSFKNFIEFLDFVSSNPFFDSVRCKEYYEFEIYAEKNVYFVNPALQRILKKKKSLFNKFCIEDVSKKFWNYKYVDELWKAEKINA